MVRSVKFQSHITKLNGDSVHDRKGTEFKYEFGLLFIGKLVAYFFVPSLLRYSEGTAIITLKGNCRHKEGLPSTTLDAQ